MALEIRFKVENLGVAVEKAGYTVIDSVRTEVENGFTSIAEDGSCVIPITSKWVGLNERLRVTVDDYDGSNYLLSGSATDWVRATEVYVDYAVIQNGVFVTCRNQSNTTTPWDMGDGVVLAEVNPTYLYKKNGIYTITSGDFSVEVTITGVTEFSVTLTGNVVQCYKQSGVAGVWDFGDGVTSELDNTSYTFYENGIFTVSHGGYSVDIVVDYYTEGLIKSIDRNVATFQFTNGEPQGTVIDYGDNTSGTEKVHQYAQSGVYLVIAGNSRAYITVQKRVMPAVGFNVLVSEADSAIVTFKMYGALSYSMAINGDSIYLDEGEDEYTKDFNVLGAGDYLVECRAVDSNSNVGLKARVVKVQMNNVDPVINSITASSTRLIANFFIDATDDEDLAFDWSFNSTPPQTSRVQNPEITFVAEELVTGTCIVSDGRGGVVTGSVDIDIKDHLDVGGQEFVVDGDFPTLESATTDWSTYFSDVVWFDDDGTYIKLDGQDTRVSSYNRVINGLTGGSTYQLEVTQKSSYIAQSASVKLVTGNLFTARCYNTVVDTWETISNQFTVPEGDTSVTLNLSARKQENGSYYVKNASIKEVL